MLIKDFALSYTREFKFTQSLSDLSEGENYVFI